MSVLARGTALGPGSQPRYMLKGLSPVPSCFFYFFAENYEETTDQRIGVHICLLALMK